MSARHLAPGEPDYGDSMQPYRWPLMTAMHRIEPVTLSSCAVIL